MLRVRSASSKYGVIEKTFAGGEENPTFQFGDPIQSEDHRSRVTIEAYLHKSSDVMSLLMLTDAIRRALPGHEINLTMPYIPYARQDRVCNFGEALSIKVFADLINSQNYGMVTVCDPHSDVAPALINRCHVVSVDWILRNLPYAAYDRHKTVFVSPDAGANKKVFGLAKSLRLEVPVIRADKIRDVATGQITDTVVYGDVKNKETFIVDDICDGGRTFIALAKKLKEGGASKVSLYVTHGIFSYGVDILSEYIDEIWCPFIWDENINSKNNTKDRFLKTFNILAVP